jgi:dTDP-4-amino-4,6-dideoxygalactose transaminase
VLSRPWLFWIPKSLPFLGLGETHYDPGFAIKRLSAFQAGTTTGWLQRLDELKKIRQKNAAYYCKSGVKPTGGTGLLSSDMIRFPVLIATAADKLAVLSESARLGLGGAEAYPTTVDAIAELQGRIVGGTSVKARTIVERLVTFPVHPYVKEADMDKITGLIQKL